MTSPFNITTATNSITLDARLTGKAAFTVSNTSSATIRARARITSPDASIVPWFSVEGQTGRVLAPAGTEQYTVDLAVPPTTTPKDYTFSLLMVDESNPDENFTEGPAVKVTVPAPAPAPAKKPFSWWIVAVAVVVVILVGVAIGMIVNQNNQAHAQATATALALACKASPVPAHGLYTVLVNGTFPVSGTVTIQFSLPQATNQSHQNFAAGSFLTQIGAFPVCVTWDPIVFNCNNSNWEPTAGAIHVTNFIGPCSNQLPAGVLSVNLTTVV